MNILHLTQTRISIPRKRNNLVTRQRLLDALDELLEKRVILVAAPAGYGKTSLLMDFADDLAVPVCWYSLDAADQSIIRFLEYFVTAIQRQFPTFGNQTINLLHAIEQKETDIDSLVTSLANEVFDQITEHFVLVLDDYHLVEKNVPINQFLSRFLQNVEENCHIIFSSRTLISLPDLPLLVARGLVGGLSFEDLAFTPEEVRELFINNHQIVLTERESKQLCTQTEGWITGLLLTAQASISRLHAKDRALKATGVGIQDYFELIFNAQSEDIQSFLLFTSLLEDYNFNLVIQTIAKLFPGIAKKYKTHVNYLLKSNLFIQSVGDDGLSYRYHHLFLEYLQNKLRMEHWDNYQALQEIIAQYYLDDQQWEKAYQIYKKENRLADQINVLQKAGLPLMSSGRFGILQQWMDEIPEDELHQSPALCSLMGTILSMTGDIKNSLAYLSRALATLSTEKDRALMARTMVRKAAVLRLQGFFSEAAVLAQEVLEIVADDLSLRPIRAEAYKTIGGCFFELGNLPKSQFFLQLALEDFTFLKRDNDIAIVSLDLGSVSYSIGEFDKAKQYFQSDIDYWERTSNHAWLANVLNNLGVLQYLSGDIENAVTNLEKALHYARLSNYYRMEASVLNGIGDLYADLGALEEAADLYQQGLEISTRIDVKYVTVYALCNLALLSCYNNQKKPALDILSKARIIANEMKSDFEIHLVDFVDGYLNFKEKNYEEALVLFSKTTQFFLDNQHITYIGRSALYTALTQAALKRTSDFQETLIILEKYLHIEEIQFSILPYGLREYKAVHHVSQLNPDSKPLFQWIEHLDEFRRNISAFRRRLRRKNLLVPFAPARLEIITLGEMKVKFNDKWLTISDWQTQSARDFFFLILSQPHGLTKEEIGLQLWPEDSEQEFKFHFKNAVYRVRHAIGKESILLIDDRYLFNRELDYQFDADMFRREIAAARKCDNPQLKMDHYQTAIDLYRGMYLPDMEADWIMLEREKLHQQFIDTMIEITRTAFEQGNYTLSIQYAKQTLEIEPCQEEMVRIAMRAHAANGNRGEIARLFKQCEKNLKRELDAPPSDRTQKVFLSLMK
jgi:ATP/maltotriose-dependent transcriptional regulator MalT/DNA-binding SARP family transcriptional activator